MELSIEQSCPSCGAAIVLNEDDKLIRCDFCDVSNFRLDSAAPRYVLPHKLPEDMSEDDLIYVPYLRFKGVVYFVDRERVVHKIVDTTRLAVGVQSLAPSLGLRPQVMKVRPVTNAMDGTFVLQTVPVKAAFVQATKLVDLFSDKKNTTVVHRAFIGETISVIYQPYYIKNDRLVDAVDGRLIGSADNLLLDQLKGSESKKSWEPSFIGTICTQCGGLMTGERDSRVLTCESCLTHWLENKGRLKPVSWSVVESSGGQDIFFPFWKISFSTSGYEITDFRDLIDFTNQPIIIGNTIESEELYFLLPAFKVNPKMYLQLASQLTIAQGKIPQGTSRGKISSHPVNLDVTEAVQAIKSVLAHLTVGKKKRLLNLPKITTVVHRTELLYLPFTKKVHDYLQCHTPASIQVAAVRYGRSL
ncbi:TFIIB-type zinc ribbon-containing protein [Desulforhopalus sp. 52FAK]